MGIYIWGTGCGASEVLEQGLDLDLVAGFVDNFPFGERFLGKPVYRPGELTLSDVELVIVTARQAGAIRESCKQNGIPLEKCLFLKNHLEATDWNDGCPAAEGLLGKELLERLIPGMRLITEPQQLRRPRLEERALEGDYVRLATLELLCRRVEKLPGCAGELGVYKGFFARCINELLPEKRLYLFDSFRGFAKEARASDAFQAAHENTAAEQVRASMPHPEMVVLKVGFFPESLQGLEEAFCLVSLDVDFAGATLAGLRYFWPRLVKGGYLMLHDWGNPKLPGVREALEAFEEEIGEKLPGVPLCDVGGTLVLGK